MSGIFRRHAAWHTRWAIVLLLFAATQATVAAQAPAAPGAPPANAADRWEPTIAGFEAADQKDAPPKGAVLFVGSSSIVMWKTLAKDFPEIKTINRGFGGSILPEVNRYVERIVVPYAPKQVVLYCGDNDIASGRTPQQVLADFQTFAAKVRAGVPDARIVYIAIKPSPSRWKLRGLMWDANRRIQRWINSPDGPGNAAYVDTYFPMLDETGQPRPELYLSDKLHMTPEGYRLWTALVRPVLLSPR